MFAHDVKIGYFEKDQSGKLKEVSNMDYANNLIKDITIDARG